ncbi:MAG: ABC transporter substrate-binding protein [Bacteroidales bacterium]|nr:ABC transporter substrate-binding protein [Candidatus Cacconaster scatequi]
MKKLVTTLAALSLASSLFAQKIVFTPQWTPQAQFSGYYVAYEKGFYSDEGLDVEIRHLSSNSTETTTSEMMKGNADIVGVQLLSAMTARSDGDKIVNVLQLTQKSGLCCVSHKPISSPEELDSLKVGRWRAGFADFCDVLETHIGIKINWIPILNTVNLYVYNAVDATLAFSFSELIALELATGKIPDDHIIRFSNFGYEAPEDGLYVTEDYYNKNKELVDKFVRASKRGWDYTRDNRKEALDITWKYIREHNISTNREHQKRMLDEYLDLQVNPETGVADYAAVKPEVFVKMVEALRNTGHIVNNIEYEDLIK